VASWNEEPAAPVFTLREKTVEDGLIVSTTLLLPEPIPLTFSLQAAVLLVPSVTSRTPTDLPALMPNITPLLAL